MKEQNILNPKNLENCNENNIYCTIEGCFIKCNGKWYKLVDDTFIEIFVDNSTNINSKDKE